MKEKEGTNPNWIPLTDVLDVLHHPDFYWGYINSDLKYIELRIDTRDNCCLVKDRNGKPVCIQDVKIAIQNAKMKGMNTNKPKYTESQIEEAFEILRDFVKGELLQDVRAASFIRSLETTH